jgi:hypothetical protein
VPQSAREGRMVPNLSPLKITNSAPKQGLPIKKVDVFPASVAVKSSSSDQDTGAAPPGPGQTLLEPKAVVTARKPHTATAPVEATAGKTESAQQRNAVPANIHVEDVSRALTAAPHRPEGLTTSYGAFPQRQALRKHSEGLPDHILLARDRIRVESFPSRDKSGHRSPNASEKGSSPPKSPAEQNKGGHVLFIPNTPSTSSHAAAGTDTGGGSGTRAGSGNKQDILDLNTVGESVHFSTISHRDEQGYNLNGKSHAEFESRVAPNSRNSVRVMLPTAASSSPGEMHSPEDRGNIGMEAHADDALTVAGSDASFLATPYTDTGAHSAAHGSGVKGHKHSGNRVTTPNKRSVKPIQFQVDADQFEQELQQDLTLYSTLHGGSHAPQHSTGAHQRPDLGSREGTVVTAVPRTPTTARVNTASCTVHELTIDPTSPTAKAPASPSSGGFSSGRIRHSAGSGQKHRVLVQRQGKHGGVLRQRIPLSSPMNDSPDKHSQQNHQALTMQLASPAVHSTVVSIPSVGSPMKRRQVSDALSGTRTAAVSGGLLLQSGQADFNELLNSSAEVSSALAVISFGTPERAVPGANNAHSDGSGAADSPPLSPAAVVAIEAARVAAQQDLRLSRALSPATVLRNYAAHFTAAEKDEIQHYPRIYHLGLSQAQRSAHLRAVANANITRQSKEVSSLSASATTSGVVNTTYDTADGTYRAITGDQLRYRYEILQLLGRGSFGEVYRCRDHKSGVDVAVKVIKSTAPFSAQADKELDILRYLATQEGDHTHSASTVVRAGTSSGFTNAATVTQPQLRASSAGSTVSAPGTAAQHHSVIQLVDSFLYREHKCLVFPVYGRNLYEHLQDRNYKGLPMSAVRRIAVQLFQALAHLRRLNIIHCDIKPENILLKDFSITGANTSAVGANVDIVLIDFGSSCRVGEQSFTYIQSRFYRSPEVLLNLPYGKKRHMPFSSCCCSVWSYEVHVTHAVTVVLLCHECSCISA